MALTRVKFREESAAIALFERIAGTDLPGRRTLSDAMTSVGCVAGQSIFLEDEPHPYVYVIVSGLVKLTYLRPDGVEWIKSLVCEGQFFASLSALVAGNTSFAATAVEPCRLERIAFATLRDLAERDLAWSRMLINALMLFAERKERRERQLLTLSAEERYRLLLREEAHLVSRIPQKDLAAYLGVTPVGLSRIARRVRTDEAMAKSGHQG